MLKLIRVLLLGLLAAMSPAGHAGHISEITLGFDLPAPQPEALSNYFESGFRVSGNCHVHFLTRGLPSQWVGFDGSGCTTTDFNPNFLGPAQFTRPSLDVFLATGPVLWIDFNGSPFTLVSFFSITGDFLLHSSKGGFADFFRPNPVLTTVSFSGSEWESLEWLLFTQPGGGSGSPHGFDNIVFRVTEPSTIALLGLGLVAGLVVARRRTIG